MNMCPPSHANPTPCASSLLVFVRESDKAGRVWIFFFVFLFFSCTSFLSESLSEPCITPVQHLSWWLVWIDSTGMLLPFLPSFELADQFLLTWLFQIVLPRGSSAGLSSVRPSGLIEGFPSTAICRDFTAWLIWYRAIACLLTGSRPRVARATFHSLTIAPDHTHTECLGITAISQKASKTTRQRFFVRRALICVFGAHLPSALDIATSRRRSGLSKVDLSTDHQNLANAHTPKSSGWTNSSAWSCHSIPQG